MRRQAYALRVAAIALICACGRSRLDDVFTSGESTSGSAGAPEAGATGQQATGLDGAAALGGHPDTGSAGTYQDPAPMGLSRDAGLESAIGGRDGGQQDGRGAGGGLSAVSNVGPDLSSNYAINSAHDGTQPSSRIASPLTKLWSAMFEGPVLYPIVAGGRVFLSTAMGGHAVVVAYDLETGRPIWGPVFQSNIVLLSYESGRLYGFDRSGLLQAWDEATGRVLWTKSLYQVDGQYAFDGQMPVAEGGIVYVTGDGGGATVYAVDEATGALRWHADYNASANTVAVGDGVVYATGVCQWVFSFDAATGNEKTIHSNPCTGGGGAMPYYYDGHIFVRDLLVGDIIIDREGNPVGSFPGEAIPAFHNGVAFYLNGTLDAVDLTTDVILPRFGGHHSEGVDGVHGGAEEAAHPPQVHG